MRKFPIDNLRKDLLKYVQTYLPELNNELNENIRYQGLDKNIGYYQTNSPIDIVAEIKEIDGKNRIILYDNFLQFLWCVSYSIIVFYDQFYKKKATGDFDSNEYEKALNVFRAGMSLFEKHEYEQFYKLPNPTDLFTEKKPEYISKASNLFSIAFSFVLSHELAHHYLGHLDKIYIPENESQIKKDEIIADELAYSFIEKTDVSNGELNIKTGIIIALSSLILLDNTLKGGNEHPDPDSRLKIILEKMNLKPTDALWDLASMMLLLWAEYYNIEIGINEASVNGYETFNKIYKICQDKK